MMRKKIANEIEDSLKTKTVTLYNKSENMGSSQRTAN